VLGPACVIVGTATDGPAALQAAATLQPDVIVLDISMPGMSGLEVAARLRNTGSPAAVVFLSLHEEEEVLEAAAEVGGLGYVVKRRLVSDLLVAVLEARAGRRFVSKT
jgi:DNA-binding NarL/FixJ family response regulator